MPEKNLERKGQRTAGRKTVSLPVRFTPRFLDDADSRIAVVRQIRKLTARLMDEAGGHESFQREMMCSHAAFLHVRLTTLEVEALEGGKLDWGSFIQAINSLSGVLKMLGLERRLKQVGGLKAFIKERNGQ